MKNLIKSSLLLSSLFILAACGNSEKEEKQQIKLGEQTTRQAPASTPAKSSKDMVDFSNKGIGPIKSVTISDNIDAALAEKGRVVFDNMCIACHKIDRKFIGPKIQGVTKLRAPEWIMNMILNPEEMIQKDPIAQQLLIESNMAVMANQNIKEDEARAMLEYFRQIDQE
jgi:mono/diheme cytochrome c family protein